MRIRTIKPEFFKHDKLAELPALTRLLFQGIWCLADSEGRLQDRPKRIQVEVLPYDTLDVDAALWDLHRNGFIVRYTAADDEQYIEVKNFRKHQRITGKEAETISSIPKHIGETSGKQSGNIGETPETTGKEGKGKEGNGKEGNGKEGGVGEVVVSGKPKTPRLPKLSDEEFIQSLSDDPTYARINVRTEYGKMLRWCQQKNKVPSQARLINWLNRIETPMELLATNGAVRQPPGQIKTDVTINDIREL